MVFVRKVPGRNGAVKVQIAERRDRRDVVLEHVGTAHNDGELAALLRIANDHLHPGQETLPLDTDSGKMPGQAVVVAQESRLLLEAIRSVYRFLGFEEALGDEGFFQLVAARLIAPGSVRAAGLVLEELGVAARHRNSLQSALERANRDDYRAKIATACFRHALSDGDLSLVLYDVTTLYFEAEKEDELRKVGYSKERRADPQIVVGLLVDRAGFPLEVSCWEGNKAETQTILPTVKAFQERHGAHDMVVVADAGMLSASNLRELDEAGLRFIVGARQTRAPHDLEAHFHWHGDAFADGQLVDTITPRGNARENATSDLKVKAEPKWDPRTHEQSWRAVWAYSAKRGARDAKTLRLQEERARDIVEGRRQAKKARFVAQARGSASIDEKGIERARMLVGLKGYVTNIPKHLMPASEVITSYHDLWHVEQSFRMSKTDLKARPIFHHTRDAIEAHLTVVITALAVARDIQRRTGTTLKSVVRQLRPLRHVTIRIAGHNITAQPTIPPTAKTILDSLAT